VHGQGERERDVLASLRGYRMKGEWVRDTEETRAILREAFGSGWAFPYNPRDFEKERRRREEQAAEAAVLQLCASIEAEKGDKSGWHRYRRHKAWSDEQAAKRAAQKAAKQASKQIQVA